MKNLAAICVLPLAFAGLSACGDEANVNITLDEATYLSALEDEDLGTEEGDESGSTEEAADVEEQFACSFDEIKERIRNRFDRTRQQNRQFGSEYFGGSGICKTATGRARRAGPQAGGAKRNFRRITDRYVAPT